MNFLEAVKSERHLVIRQRKELAELFGFETRNKYEILNSYGTPLGFAAEQQKGLLGFLFRQLLGHWRSFTIHIFNTDKQVVFTATQPFRFFFQRLEISDASGRPIGALQQRFALLSKKFDVEDVRGNAIIEVRSPLWRIWTFPFRKGESQVATVAKKWSGGITEIFTDADNFHIEFHSPALTEQERILILLSGLFIDLQYFEAKAD